MNNIIKLIDLKCMDKTCPFKKTCYRYTSLNKEVKQLIISESPFNDDEVECNYYIKEIINNLKN